MSWIAPDAAALHGVLSAPEMDAARRHAHQGMPDPAQQALEAAVATVRGYCAGRALGAAGTVPPELWDATLILARHTLLSRLPVTSLLTDGRQKARDEAMTLLRDVAGGRYHISPGDGSGAVPAPTPRITPRVRTGGLWT